MRIIYFDIDSLRPDHLGCYGYHRDTSPNIDRIAGQGVRFENCYASDAPCLPSRSAMFSGRFGIHNGVVNHGGVAAEPLPDGKSRGFRSVLGETCWMSCLRKAHYRTVTISSFGERHSAFHWYAGFSEILNPGKCGLERADEVSPIALDWLERNGRADNWFVHVNLWDPHTPYRTPDSLGNPFKGDPLPAWYTEDVRHRHWDGCGPHSAREVMGFGNDWEWDYARMWPKQPVVIDSMQQARRMFDGYDCGVRFADEYIGRIIDKLADLNVIDDTAIIISADHGENLGELNIYCDHQTADQITCRVPLIVRVPGVTDSARVDEGLIYNVDLAATLVELAGGKVPDNWDGRSFAGPFRRNESFSREFLVLSQCAWSCQRSVRFDRWLFIQSYHDGYHAFPEQMLFDLSNDPHEQHNIATENETVVSRATRLLTDWHEQMRQIATQRLDPMQTVLTEGGPFHTRGQLPAYLKRLRGTDRSRWAALLEAKHPGDVEMHYVE